MERREYTFDRVVRMIIAILFVLGAIWLVYVLRGVLLPFFIACLIAYVFEPFVQYNRQLLKLRGRVGAVFVTLFEAVFLFGILMYFVSPMIMGEMHEMAGILKRYAATEFHGSFIPQGVHDFLRRSVDFESLSETLTRQEWMTMIEDTIKASWDIISGGVAILISIFNWCIVVLYVVFIMIDYERLHRSFRAMVPPRYRDMVYGVAGDIKSSMNHYFRGQALIAAIVGVLFAIGFLIIGMPMAIMFGLFIGVLNMVPYLQLVSLVPAVGLCIVYSAGGDGAFWSIMIQCITVYCIVQAIQDLYLTPRIMGKAMGLNPAIILLSLSVWGTLLGFIGLIIALPLTTLIISYYERFISGSGLPWRKKEAKAINDVIDRSMD